MKKTLFLLLIMLFGSAGAVTINAPEEIPSNINWSFSVELDPSNSFTKTEIYFDDLLIVNAYNDKQPVIEKDFVLKAFVFDKVPEDNTGLTVYVSYFGIEEGSHKIKTKTFNQGNLTEEKELQIESIDTITAISGMSSLPEEVKQDVDLLMKGIIKINEDKTMMEELKNSTEQNIQEKTQSLQIEIKQLEESLQELNSAKELEEKKAKHEEIQDLMKKDFEIKNENNYLTGFYAFSVDHAWYGIVFLICLLVLLALFQTYKIKANNGDTIFEEALEEQGIDEEKRKFYLSENEEENKKEDKPKKRFSLGDLIRK